MKQSVISGIRLASMCEGGAPYGLVEDAGIAIEGDMIVWAGAMSNLPERFSGWERTDFGGRLATPALVDCHTHLVFGGNRAREFEMRLEGASYEEVARAGGGIVSTVSATRGMDEDALVEDALKRLDALLAEGVATVEVKSGYGLTVEDELKMLRAARRLAELRPVRIKTSYLAAHAVPAEYRGREDAYIDAVVLPGMDAAHAEGLVDAVDGFCEGIAFSPAQMARVFDRARELGLPVKLHAEQLSNLGGAKMAASYGALSADHLEYLDEEGVAAMAASGTVAVLLPGAFYTLRETQYPPLAALRKHGVRIAVATDCNPGSSPLASLLLTVNMACTLFRMTPEEALAGATREGARALGLAEEIGTIEAGKRAEIAIWDVAHPAELAYRIGFNPLHRRIAGDFA
ncbi:imidazolonepropionase [Nitratireductor aquimarinus]|uniref:imidazolonepropionase n=1 Tax=Nitratireductor TaxID=245876 RepID=UPI0019D3D373|nr:MULTISPECIES: imidazolonepropionase [Nitratireductor]MBN7777979.1 imidazolonepropionase [Nitratireductor pacificus]MBN7782301.1 imidazolonepropionase [Nitratireductor pacificus]MBN7791108.1 imidazolonepropionase [Nitratireductor aquimarinus]MBY6100188.1 imidazolonepropionase [Nitratireductor aquimarinus]MCA1261331.1 imidazolonepropionase [Nitratireductor aquimarinus]